MDHDARAALLSVEVGKDEECVAVADTTEGLKSVPSL